MLVNLLILAILVICVEAITEIVVASKITLGIRNWLLKNAKFLGSLINCGYCTSVWVSATLAWFVPINMSAMVVDAGFFNKIIDYVIFLFVIHRLSNIWHEFIVRWLGRYPMFGGFVEVEDEEINE